MKNQKKLLLGLLVLAILILASVNTQLVSATGFTDVKVTDWYYISVNRLVDLGIITGVGNNKFAPNKSVTRAEFVTFLCKAIGLLQEDGYTFSDTKSHWSSKWISAAITSNIIDKGTTFNPNKTITRQEAVEMLCRALDLSADTSLVTPYSDVKTDEGYSNRAYEEYLMLGTINDDGRYFYPNGNLTRSEVSAVLVDLIDYEADIESFKAEKKAVVVKQEQERLDNIYSISMKKGNELLFTVKREKIDLNWIVVTPYVCDGDDFGISNIMYAINNMTEYQIVDADSIKLEDYGLKEPLYTLEYETKKSKIKIYLGKKDKDTIYATKDYKKIYKISFWDDEFINNPLKVVISPFVYIVHINNVKKLDVKFDDKVVSCNINTFDDNTKDQFTVNSKDANVVDNSCKSLFRLFYASVIGVKINNFEFDAIPKGEAEITFTYTLKVSPYTMKVEFISKDEDYYYVIKNGEYNGLVVAKSEFDEPDGLRESYKKLMEVLK